MGKAYDWLLNHLDTETTACVAWPWRIDTKGYPVVCVDGRRIAAHRVMCRLAYGEPATNNLHAAHRCGRSSCINPHHLYWATSKQNEADKREHGTAAIGVRHGMAVLTEGEVLEIKRMLSSGMRQREIADRFEVSRPLVSHINTGRKWRHLGGV